MYSCHFYTRTHGSKVNGHLADRWFLNKYWPFKEPNNPRPCSMVLTCCAGLGDLQREASIIGLSTCAAQRCPKASITLAHSLQSLKALKYVPKKCLYFTCASGSEPDEKSGKCGDQCNLLSVFLKQLCHHQWSQLTPAPSFLLVQWMTLDMCYPPTFGRATNEWRKAFSASPARLLMRRHCQVPRCSIHTVTALVYKLHLASCLFWSQWDPGYSYILLFLFKRMLIWSSAIVSS